MRSLLTRWISAITACAMFTTALPVHAQGKGKKPDDDPKVAEAKKHMEAGAAFFNDPAVTSARKLLPSSRKLTSSSAR